jgi:16S rRNA (cytosine967-C5)-methyltransferase
MPLNTNTKKINIRKKAADFIYLTEQEDSYADILLDNFVRSSKINTKDRRLLTEILYGTLRNKMRIDSIIYDCTDKNKRIDGYVLNILRISVYQLLFLDRVPDFAAINEAVNITKISKKAFSAGFVNAVLRKIAKNKSACLKKPELSNLSEISSYFSFPLWLAEYFIKKFGMKGALEYFNHSLSPARLVIRKTNAVDSDTLENSFEDEKVRYEKLPLPSDAYAIIPAASLSDLNCYKKGYFTVQSAASSLVVKILSPKKGETIFDLCSAPGTKAVEISEIVGDKGLVIAGDLHLGRLLKVKENISRFNLRNVRLICCDASIPLPVKPDFLADRIILDVPCSGLGTVQKKPDIKYKIKYDDIKRLADLQYNILQNASRFLKQGGELVYSTCTLTDEENEGVVKKFLEHNNDFMIKNINNADLTKNRMIDENGFFRTFPHIHFTDGFFAAVITKKAKKV